MSYVIAIDHAKYQANSTVSLMKSEQGCHKPAEKNPARIQDFSNGFQPFSHVLAWNGDVFSAFPAFTHPEKTLLLKIIWVEAIPIREKWVETPGEIIY